MTPLLKVKPGVVLRGIRPEITRAEHVVVTIFGRHGYDCWLTCAVRPGEASAHGRGLAEDFDSSTHIPEETGHQIGRSVESYLSDNYDVAWRGPYWHLHVEFDGK